MLSIFLTCTVVNYVICFCMFIFWRYFPKKKYIKDRPAETRQRVTITQSFVYLFCLSVGKVGGFSRDGINFLYI
jgi:3-deoxy-D-manno-octulosonic-acid transferase